MGAIADVASWVTGDQTLIGLFGTVTAQKEASAAAQRQFELDKERLAVNKAQAQRDAELAALDRASSLVNNQQLWTVVKWLGAAVAASLVGLIVTNLLKSRRRK